MTDALAAGRLAAAIAAAVIVPGAAALRLAGHPSRGIERAALAVTASITLWPLALLWTTALGLRWSAGAFATALAVLAIGLAVGPAHRALRRRQRATSSPAAAVPEPPDGPAVRRAAPSPESLAAIAILGLAVCLRVWQARQLVAPAWVDGLHHALVTRLIADAGAVPAGYRPYLAVDGFYYHFGFHALAAAVGWLADAPAPWAVLWTGQALSAAAALTTYAAARRLVRRPAAALAALAVPASLYWFPAYFVSWARYTQLAGLVALPGVWMLVADAVHGPATTAAGDEAEPDRKRPLGRRPWHWARRFDPAARLPLVALAAACCAGLVVVHYRVSVFFGVGVAVAVAVALPGRAPGARGRLARLALVAGLALALVAPWAVRHLGPGVVALAGTSPDWARGSAETVDAIGLSARQAWLFTQGTNGVWLRLAAAGWLLAAARGRRAGWAVVLGLACAAALVAPGWIGMAASWMLPPFALAISLYVLVAWGVAWWLEAVADAAGGTAAAPAWRLAALSGAELTVAGAWAARADPGWMAAVLGGDPGAVRAAFPAGWSAWPAAAQAAGAALVAWALHAGRSMAAAPSASAALGSAARRAHVTRAVPALVVVALAVAGAWRMRDIVNPATVIVQAPDVAAAAWIRAHTPATARFVVATAPWHLGTYRGLDGGYWLPLLADRPTTMPAALYTYGAPADVRAVGALAATVARGDALDDAALLATMAAAGADYVYVGPASAGKREALSVVRLRNHPGLVGVYDHAGVAIFRRRRPGDPPPAP